MKFLKLPSPAAAPALTLSQNELKRWLSKLFNALVQLDFPRWLKIKIKMYIRF